MKKFTILFSIAMLSIAMSKAQGIKFERNLSWTQILAKAKAEDKYIFVDCFATWCGPCKEMDENIYPSKMIGDYFNNHFISVKVQMDKTKNDSLNIRSWYIDARTIQQQYNINAFPSFLFFSPDGQIKHKDMGYKPEKQLIDVAQAATNPKEQYYVLMRKYLTLNPSNMLSLVRTAKAMEGKEVAYKLADKYINQLSDEQLFLSDNIWLMCEFTKSTKDRSFSILRDNGDKIKLAEPKITDEYLKFIIQNVIYESEIRPYATNLNGKPDWEKIKQNVKEYGEAGQATYIAKRPGMLFNSEIEPELEKDANWNKILLLIKRQKAGEGEEFITGSTVIYYMNAINSGKEKDLKNFMLAAKTYAKNFPDKLSALSRNNWAWLVFEKSKDEGELKTALVWSKMVIAEEPNVGNWYDTYANLLYKLGREEEAIQFEEKALKLEPTNDDIKVNLEKMKRSEPTWSVK